MKLIRFTTALIGCSFLIQSCATVKPQGAFDPQLSPPTPAYADPTNWAALPDRADAADLTPPGLEDRQAETQIDVFFVHPTIYIGRKGEDQWNAPIQDPALIEDVDSSTIKFQASLFNGVGKVYAPRYRQAHFNCYFNKDTSSALQAFEVAYQDVKSAFEYYLEHYNQGRPIIIASHSQGTTHAKRLLKEFFDGTTLKNRLVVAYLAGILVEKDYFKALPLCQSPIQTGCFCAWRTYKEGKGPKPEWTGPNIAVTNPISWTTDPQPATIEENKGAVLRGFTVKPETTDAFINPEKGILQTHRPKVFGAALLQGN
ncbi:MAG: DUF3089 domain-containing protein [Phaeodactylibacter sp.]|nr:DUF3089 domain-containing protein [Phaeodactylibacter sp.]